MMNTRLALILTAGVLPLLGLVFFLGTTLQQNRSLHREKDLLVASIGLLENRVTALAAATNELAARLQEETENIRATALSASNAVAALAAEQARTQRNPPPQQRVMPRPYQLPAYLGQQHLGLAWVIPMNVKENIASGQITCEHFIQLPDTARHSFTTYVTNLVEQPVFMPPQVVERSVYVDRGYNWIWTPPRGGHGPVDPGFGQPPPVQPPTPPAQSGLYVPSKGGIYKPPGIR